MPQEQQYNGYIALADEDGKLLQELVIDYTILDGRPYITELLWVDFEAELQ